MLLRCRTAAACVVLFFACVGVRAQVLTEPVGTISPVQTATVTVATAGTIGAINVLTQGAPNLDFKFVSGGSCAVGSAYATGQTCTVQYTLTPRVSAPRYGGITLTAGATVLGSGYIYGAGTGPLLTFDASTSTPISGGLINSTGLAVDASGNIFVADWGLGVVNEITAASGYATKNSIGSGFIHPVSVAVDGIGNVFIGDQGTNPTKGDAAILEVLAAGGYTTVKLLSHAFLNPTGIGVDGSGNLFVEDTTSASVVEFTVASGYATVNVLAQTNGHLMVPAGLALDVNSNLFITDTGTQTVKEILAADGYTTVNTLGGTYKNPDSIAVDASDNLYVANNFGGVAAEYYAAGNYVTSKAFSGVYAPWGVALDGAGGVFVLNARASNVVKFDSAAPTLTFATTKVGTVSTDSPQTLTVFNTGNSALTFSPPSIGTNPVITSGFTIGSGSTCPVLSPGSVAVAMAAGASCTYQISFAPLAPVAYNGTLTITDDSMNVPGSIQTAFLIGAGSNVPVTTVSTLSTSSNPAPVGTSVTLTASVVANPTTSTPLTGTVTFYNGAVNLGSTALVSGTASLILNILPAGQDSLTCTYSGDSNFAASNCNTVSETIYSPQTITFPQPPTQAYAGTSVLLTATASSGLPVTYSVIQGPATVSGSVLTYTGAGTVVVEADQAGNATYTAAVPVQKTVTTTVLTVLVGSTQAVQTLVTISAAGTLGTTNVLTQGAPNLDFKLAAIPGGTCSSIVVYSAGDTCTIIFTFKPTRPGLRFGGISLTSTTGATIANAYIYGLGVGPQVIYTPGSQSTFGSGYTYASGVAVDGNGNAYVSDLGGTASGGLYEVPAGGGPQRSIGSFANPADVAVDGSGNVFVIYGVARGSLAEIYAVNGVIPANPTINVITTSLLSLNGMKVDGNGNVYLASSDSLGGSSMIQEVLAVNGSIPANPTFLTLVSGVGGPTGVAVDQSGNVYFSDEIGNSAYEVYAVNGVIPANPTVTALASNLSQPSNIVLDAANDVFVTESNAVVELVAANGVVAPNTAQQVNIGTGLSFPQGMDVDASGNIYIADSGLPSAVKLDFSDAPSLTFATTQVGSTSSDSPQTVRFANGGNADLSFLKPGSGSNPSITAGYTFTSTCPVLIGANGLTFALPPGASCAESISFTPVVAGPDAGALTITDNNLNVVNAQQNILLNARGTLAPTTLTLIPSANPVFALQPLTFTVHLTTNGQGDVGQNVILTYTVGTLVVTASLTTDATGSASYAVVGGLNPGSYVVSAAFAGTTGYQASSATITEGVNAILTTSVLSVFPIQPVVNTNIVLTAVVTAQLSGPAPGTVTFFNGTATLGTVALSSAGVAQFTIPSLPLGNYSFTCTYNGATDYATSNCQTISETVVPEPDFSLTATPPSITIETQHHKTMQLTLAGIGLFAGSVHLGCQGPLPPYLTCELPQSETLAVGQTLNFNFTMDTDAVLDFLAATRPVEKTPWTNAPGRMVLAMLLPLALAGFARRRKTLRRLLLLAVLVVGAAGLTACGNKWPGHTPPGVYTIPVVGTSTYNGTTITHTLNITLTVTP